MVLKDALLCVPFKESAFASAFPGMIVFGIVKLKTGQLEYAEESTFKVDYYKLSEFAEILEVLGRNVLIEGEEGIEPESKVIEIGADETIRVDNLSLLRHRSGNPVSVIHFDHFSYIHFIIALKNVSIFIINPTRTEYMVMLKYQNLENSNLSSEEELVTEAAKLENANEFEIFLYEMFLKVNLPLLRFCIKLKKMA